jgi:hypothetical protein
MLLLNLPKAVFPDMGMRTTGGMGKDFMRDVAEKTLLKSAHWLA